MKILALGLAAAAVGLSIAVHSSADDPALLPPVVTLTRDSDTDAAGAPAPDADAGPVADALFGFSWADTAAATSSPLASLAALTGLTSADAAPVGCPCPSPCPCQPGMAGAAGFGGPPGERTKLFGDWGGVRTRLLDRGMKFDIYSTNFFNQVANGGREETFSYRGRMDYLLNVDGEKAGLWKGLFIDLHGESIYGDTINRYTGTFAPVSIAQLVPVPNGSVTALTGVKITQALSENFIVYGGKLNILDQFNQPFTGGARGVNGFLNGAMLFPLQFARQVPYSTYGFGAAVLKNLEPILAFTVLDANNTPTVSGFDTFFADGAVLLPQINIPTNFFGLPGHQGLIGAWSSKKYATIDRTALLNVLEGAPVSTLRKGASWSLSYLFDQALYVSPCDPKRMWGVFGNLGIADTSPSPVRWFGNIGLGGSSPLQGRKLDSFGIGYYYLGLNSSFKNIAPRVLPLRDEHGVEAFYNVGVTPWCHITPDVQFVLPAQERAEHLWYIGMRAKVDF